VASSAEQQGCQGRGIRRFRDFGLLSFVGQSKLHAKLSGVGFDFSERQHGSTEAGSVPYRELPA
jgi:hypothetical protein